MPIEIIKKLYKYIIVIIAINLVIAYGFPLSNDEVYYIGWGRNLHLSYLDAPPFVSYLTHIQQSFGFDSSLSLRILVVILHLLASYLLVLTSLELSRDDDTWLRVYKAKMVLFLSYLIPIFGVFAFSILPDSGLILGISLLGYCYARVVIAQDVRYINFIGLGVASGIMILSKYHGFIIVTVIALSLFRRGSYRKLILAFLIAVVLSSPVLLWNWQNNFASFRFQLQHGFSGGGFNYHLPLNFILGVLAYLLPWYGYLIVSKLKLINRGILWSAVVLFIIIAYSSLFKPVLPHWVAPCFWLVLPWVIATITQPRRWLYIVNKITLLLWLVLAGICILPNREVIIKDIAKINNPSLLGMEQVYLGLDMQEIVNNDSNIRQILDTYKPQVVATNSWMWTAQFTQYNSFTNLPIINLDITKSSSYLWQNNYAMYVGQRVMLLGIDQNSLSQYAAVLDDYHEYQFVGLGDYSKLKYVVATGILKRDILATNQQLMNNPHY